MFDHGFDYPPSYQRFRDEIDRLAAENNELQEEVDCLKEQIAEILNREEENV